MTGIPNVLQHKKSMPVELSNYFSEYEFHTATTF